LIPLVFIKIPCETEGEEKKSHEEGGKKPHRMSFEVDSQGKRSPWRKSREASCPSGSKKQWGEKREAIPHAERGREVASHFHVCSFIKGGKPTHRKSSWEGKGGWKQVSIGHRMAEKGTPKSAVFRGKGEKRDHPCYLSPGEKGGEKKREVDIFGGEGVGGKRGSGPIARVGEREEGEGLCQFLRKRRGGGGILFYQRT